MAFTGNYTCDAFKAGLTNGEFNFGAGTVDVYKIALYTNNATLNQSTTGYTDVGEVVAAGYTAGGAVLSPIVGIDAGVSYVSFSNVSWLAAVTARGALIYKDGGPAVCVLDFGSDKTSTTAFQVQFPQSTVDSAIIRLS